MRLDTENFMKELYHNFQNESKSIMKQLCTALYAWSGVRVGFHQFDTILTSDTEHIVLVLPNCLKSCIRTPNKYLHRILISVGQSLEQKIQKLSNSKIILQY